MGYEISAVRISEEKIKCVHLKIFLFIVVRIWGWVGGSSEIRTLFRFLKYLLKLDGPLLFCTHFYPVGNAGNK